MPVPLLIRASYDCIFSPPLRWGMAMCLVMINEIWANMVHRTLRQSQTHWALRVETDGCGLWSAQWMPKHVGRNKHRIQAPEAKQVKKEYTKHTSSYHPSGKLASFLLKEMSEGMWEQNPEFIQSASIWTVQMSSFCGNVECGRWGREKLSASQSIAKANLKGW